MGCNSSKSEGQQDAFVSSSNEKDYVKEEFSCPFLLKEIEYSEREITFASLKNIHTG